MEMDKQLEEIVGVMGGIPLFAGLDAAVLAALAASSCRKRAEAKERIYASGEVPHAFYCVLSGHVRRAIASGRGDEKLVDIAAAGRHFGLAELFGGSTTSYAEAVEPTVLLEIGKDGLVSAMEKSWDLSFRILTALAERQLAFELEVAAASFHSGARRVLDYLLGEAGPNLDGSRVIKLQLSKSLIAKRIGMTAESLSRALRDLSNAGLISVRGKAITLLEKLAAQRAAMLGKGDKTETAVAPEPSRAGPRDDHAVAAEPAGSRTAL